jgi:hypothetical protein
LLEEAAEARTEARRADDVAKAKQDEVCCGVHMWGGGLELGAWCGRESYPAAGIADCEGSEAESWAGRAGADEGTAGAAGGAL